MVDDIQGKFKKQMMEMARGLDKALNPGETKKVGFCLLMFDFGNVGKINYISNTVREDMIKALDEFLENFKKDK